MRKLDLSKLTELTTEDLEQYAAELETAVKNIAELTVEDLDRCAAELRAVIHGSIRERLSEKIDLRFLMLRHTIQNERALRRMAGN